MFSTKRFTIIAAALAVSLVIAGCAGSNIKLGTPNTLQQAMNTLPAVPVAGNNLKFQFGGDTWIAQSGGKNFLAGTFLSEDTSDNSVVLTLKQTHLYSSQKKPGVGGEIGWIPTPGPDISLVYKDGHLSLK